MSQFLVFLLFLDAAYVMCGLLAKKNMWKWIAAYWVILTLKNFVDFLGVG